MCNSTRRDFLRFLGLGAAGVGIGHMLFLREALGITPINPFYDAAIQIFYEGGPSQTDTWDPKPGSPNNVFPTIGLGANDIYGKPIQIASHFTNIANLIQTQPTNFGLGLFRSMTHGNGNHGTAQEYMNCFWGTQVAPRKPSTSAVMAYLYRDQTGDLGVPSVVVSGANGNAANQSKGSSVSTALEVSQDASEVVNQLSMNVDKDRYDRRQRIAGRINARFLGTRPDTMVTSWNKAWSDAIGITTKGKAARAFDLTGKPIIKGLPTSDTGLATSMTLAQELVKAGVPYISLGIGGNDTHSNNRNGVTSNWATNTDPLVSQLAKNLQAAGKRVLILMGGEFGRTPNTVASGRDGRDHWGSGFSWAALSVNQPKFKTTAVGDTGPDGMWLEKDQTLIDPIHPSALGGFLYHALGFPVGTNASYTIPVDSGYGSPVDPYEAVVNTPKLMQACGLV